MTMKIENTDKFFCTRFQWILTIPLWHLLDIMCILIHMFCNLQQQMSQNNAPHPKAHSEAPKASITTVPASPTPDTHTSHTGTLSIYFYFPTGFRFTHILTFWHLWRLTSSKILKLANVFNAKQHPNIHAN